MKRLTKDQQVLIAMGIARDIRQSLNEMAEERFAKETHSSVVVEHAIQKSLLQFFDVVC